MKQYYSNSPEETAALAQKLAEQAKAGMCYLLIGDLGSGKTSFARAFIQHLCPEVEHVPSPTYMLMQHYEGRLPIVHADLYRLENVVELEQLGLLEILDDGVLLVEWPQIAGNYFPDDALQIAFRITGDGGREIKIYSSPISHVSPHAKTCHPRT